MGNDQNLSQDYINTSKMSNICNQSNSKSSNNQNGILQDLSKVNSKNNNPKIKINPHKNLLEHDLEVKQITNIAIPSMNDLNPPQQKVPLKSHKTHINLEKKLINPLYQDKPFRGEETKILQRVQQCYRFFVELKIVKLYEKQFHQEFPTVISNKNSAIMPLRKQILEKKFHHPFFSNFRDAAFQTVQEEIEIPIDEQTLLDHSKFHYSIFTFIEKLQRAIMKLHETGKNYESLKIIHRLDKDLNIKNLQSFKKLETFLLQLHSANIEFMDMLFHQTFSLENSGNTKPISPENVLNIKQLIINSKDEKNISKDILNYEVCKQIGMKAYKENKVCFYILAGKDDEIFWNFSTINQEKPKEMIPLQLGYNINFLEILLDRYSTFSQILGVEHLTIFILANKAKMDYFNSLIALKTKQWNRLNIIMIKQTQIPCLDRQGSFIVDENFEQPSMQYRPNGTGDLWDFLATNNNQFGINYLIENEFEYVEIIGTDNILEHCFDCFMLGLNDTLNLDWSTKVVKMLNFSIFNLNCEQKMKYKNDSATIVFQNLDDITIMDINQIAFLKEKYQNHESQAYQNISSQENKFTFTNHSIFKTSFIKNKLFSQNWKQTVHFRKKLLNQKIIFEKDFYDMFLSSEPSNVQAIPQNFNDCGDSIPTRDKSKFMFLQYEREEEFYPFLYEKNGGIFDLKGCSRALSKQFLQYLDISVEKLLSRMQTEKFIRCYIDPGISLEGQGLEFIKLQIQKRLNDILSLTDLRNNSWQSLEKIQQIIVYEEDKDVAIIIN